MIAKSRVKIDELIKLANIPEKKVEKLSFREKQKHYKAKSQLGTFIFKSQDINGKGRIYRKNEAVKN